MKQSRLTNQTYWDDSWDKIKLPVEIKKSKNLYLNEILSIFDRVLRKDNNTSVLEIGGAPGQYMIYMARNFHYKISALDFSSVGCKKMRSNLRLLHVKGRIYRKDLLKDNISSLPKFDVVYSLGFIEHFSNLEKIIAKHLELLKPGGILIIGTPNFLGINHWILKVICPEKLHKHNLYSMDIKNWTRFENKFKLKKILKGYVGGFEPKMYSYEKKSFLNLLIYLFFLGVRIIITDRVKFIRKFNSKYWSGYVIGVYEKPGFDY